MQTKMVVLQSAEEVGEAMAACGSAHAYITYSRLSNVVQRMHT